jgi:serine protease Do
VLGGAGVCWGAPFPQENGEAVIKAAVVQASPSLVRIETVGGADVIGDVLAGTGPTTGVIVSADGYIITSSFNFAANPATILVTLPDSNQRLPAEIVARDHLKQLTLIKVEADNLTPAVAVPEAEIRIGQWALALGRTYDPVQPNLSLGLVSAVGRMEGRAIQTDAKISPANYGGPLIDLNGRVLGVLAPISAPGKGMTDGMNWYDSGIGFAIPLEQIERSLERLQAGTDLHPGLVGVSFAASPAFLTKPIVQEVRPNSPAAQAGFQPKDRIVRVEDKPVSTVAVIKQVLGSRYAGETVSVVIERDQQELTVEVKLAEKLEPFQFGWLGIISPREPAEAVTELNIAQVLPESPAAQAGLQKQDVIASIDQVTPESWQQFRDVWFLKAAGQTV